MNWFEKYIIRNAMEREFRQGYDHIANLGKMYAMIRSVWQDEFTEDNQYTHDVTLRRVFEQTQYKPAPLDWIARTDRTPAPDTQIIAAKATVYVNRENGKRSKALPVQVYICDVLEDGHVMWPGMGAWTHWIPRRSHLFLLKQRYFNHA